MLRIADPAEAEPAPNPPLLVDVDAVGELLGLSRRSVWRLVSKGTLPRPIKLGGSTRWRTSDIEAAVEKM